MHGLGSIKGIFTPPPRPRPHQRWHQYYPDPALRSTIRYAGPPGHRCGRLSSRTGTHACNRIKRLEEIKSRHTSADRQSCAYPTKVTHTLALIWEATNEKSSETRRRFDAYDHVTMESSRRYRQAPNTAKSAYLSRLKRPLPSIPRLSKSTSSAIPQMQRRSRSLPIHKWATMPVRAIHPPPSCRSGGQVMVQLSCVGHLCHGTKGLHILSLETRCGGLTFPP